MSPRGERRLAAILSADVVGYSRLMADDETETIRSLDRCRQEVQSRLPEHRGRLVDFTGDNFLAEFPTATDAAAFAAEVQERVGAWADELAPSRRMLLRMGLHLGEIRVEDGRVYGAGVNVAARLEALASEGGLCVSSTVRDQLRSNSRHECISIGVRRLKNIPDAIECFRVEWSTARPVVSSEREPPSVAVLPFANMSSDPDQAFFADGMAEEIINALTRVDGLRVIARTSAFSFRDTGADIAAIGSRLNVGAIVEGSVRRAGNRLRITAQLVDVAGGHHLWSEVFDRSRDDVFQIQDEIARTVVQKIRPKLVGEKTPPLVQPTTTSPDAYDLHLRAGERLWRNERWDTLRAIEMLEAAVRIDPDFADAWARLALACGQMSYSFDPDPDWHARAREAAERSFALNPDGAEAHVAQARILWSPAAGFQNAAALRALSRSVILQPGSHDALAWRGFVLFHVGLVDEALSDLEAALALQPDDPMVLNGMTQAIWYRGDYEAAAAYMSRLLDRFPGFLYAHLINTALWIYTGDLDRAERANATARGLLGDDPVLDANEALLWAHRGDERRTLAALARVASERQSLAHRHHTCHHAAAALSLLGRPEEAVSSLREASGCGLPNHFLFERDPHFAAIQDEPAMQAFLGELAAQRDAFHREFGRANPDSETAP